MKRIVLALILAVLLLTACSSAEPTTVAVATPTTEPTVAPTDTPVPPTNTPVPPTDTPIPPTDTPIPPTDTPEPTDTPVPPTDTPIPPTDTPVPPTDTPAPTDTPTPVPPTATPTVSAAKYMEQGMQFADAEQWPEAIEQFKLAVAAEPDLGIGYEFLGYSYAYNKEFENAVFNLERYLELTPDAPDRADVESALAELRQLAASTPSGVTFPAGQGALLIHNCRGEQVTSDVIPAAIFVELAARTPESCTDSELIFLNAGPYSIRASIPGVPSLGTGEFTITAGEVLEWTWY